MRITEGTIVGLWGILVLGTAWRLGGVLPSERFIFCTGSVLLVFVVTLRAWKGNGFPRDLPLNLWRPVFLFFTFVFLTLIPWPLSVLKIIAPFSAEAWRRSEVSIFREILHTIGNSDEAGIILKPRLFLELWHPLNVFPEGAWTDGLVWLSGFLVAFALAYGLAHKRYIRWIIGLLLGFAVVEAGYGLVIYWTGIGPERAGEGALGTFYNRNHYVDFLGMVLPLGIVMWVNLWRTLHRAGPRTRWGKIRVMLNERMGIFPILTLVVTILFLGIGFSLSRGGIASILLVLGIMLLFPPAYGQRSKNPMTLNNNQSKIRKRNWIRLVTLAVFLGAGLVLWVGPEPIMERFVGSPRELEVNRNRLNAWRDAIYLLPKTWLTGTGLGTFGEVFPRVQSFDSDSRWGYAHNEYLQLVVETGLIGLVLMGITVFGFIRYIHRHPRNDPEMGLYRYGCGMGLIYLGIHAFTDFNLHIPANVLLAGTLLGLTLTLSRSRLSIMMSEAPGEESKSVGIRVYILRGAGIIAMATLVFAATWYYRRESLTDALRITSVSKTKVSEQDMVSALNRLKKRGDSSRLFQYLGIRLALQSDTTGKAVQAFVKASLKNPQDYVSRHNLAQMLWHIYPSFRLAREMFRQSLEIAPSDADLRFQAGLFSWTVGDTERAIKVWRKAAELRPSLLEAIYRQVVNIADPGAMVRVTPKSEYPTLARSLIRYNFFEAAKEILRTILENSDPKEAALVLDLVVTHPNLGLTRLFFDKLKPYASQDPKINYWELFDMLQKGGDDNIPDKVRDTIHLSEKIYGIKDPRVLDDRYRLAQLLTRFGYYETAHSLYLEIVAINPNYLTAYQALGELAYNKGKYGKAYDYLRRAQLDETTRNLLFKVGQDALARNDVDLAREIFHYMRLRWVYRGYGHYGMAQVFAHEGDLWAALEEVNKALATTESAPSEWQTFKRQIEYIVGVKSKTVSN